MHILIAVHGFPPTHAAGAERRAHRTAQWLAANGHQVTVLAAESLTEPGFRLETRQEDGLTVHRLYYDVKAGDNPFRNLYDYPPVGIALRELLAQGRFDLVHVISGYLLGGQVVHTARQAGLPVVITLTEYWFLCARLNLMRITGELCTGPETDSKCARCLMEDKRRYRLPAQLAPALMDTLWMFGHHMPSARRMTDDVAQRRITLRQALEAANLVICPSQFLMQKFAEFGYDTSRFLFLRQGLAVPSAARPERKPAPDGALRLGYVGQIKQHKGVDLLVDAVIALLQQGKNIRLDLWGNETEAPDYTQELKARTAAYPAIRWNGQYSGAQVWEVLAGFDALVIPSRWYENSPNAILEAFEMRLPVVVTNLGGMAELVMPEVNGLAFELNDAAGLTHQLARLADEPDLLPRLRAGIPHVKTIDEEMREVLTFYEQMLGQRAG